MDRLHAPMRLRLPSRDYLAAIVPFNGLAALRYRSIILMIFVVYRSSLESWSLECERRKGNSIQTPLMNSESVKFHEWTVQTGPR